MRKRQRRRIYFMFIIATVAVVGSSIFAQADVYTSSIPPTGAFQTIEVQTDPWSAFNTNVTADTSYQQIYFVSDGSIIFNVTETYP